MATPLLGYPQQYYGMRKRPSYSAITGAQSGLPMFALKEMKEKEAATQTRHEEEMGLARENLDLAKQSLADLSKYKQQGLDVSEQEMTLTKTIADLERKSNEAIARRQMEQQQSEAKKAQLISGLQTGVQAVGTGYQIGSAMGLWGTGMPAPSMYQAAGAGAGAITGSGGMALAGSHLPTPVTTGVGTGVSTGGLPTAVYAAPFAAGYSFIAGKHMEREGSPIYKAAKYVSKVPIVGEILGKIIGGSCIIVSSCTDPNSYEVNITREFRDNHLDPITLKGYYELASHIVPLIKQSEQFKQYIKETLVNRLIDFGEWFMGYKDRLRFKDSETVTRNFLNTCYLMGA